MFVETHVSNEFTRKPKTIQTISKPLDLENPVTNFHLFDGGSDKPSKTGSSAPQELTLSYLCDNPKLGLQEKDVFGENFLGSLEKYRCKGKEIVSDPPVEEELRWVERDFLQLNGGDFLQLNGGIGTKGLSKREISEGIDGKNCDKKAKIDTLNLSLALPNLSLTLNSLNPLVKNSTATAIPLNSVPPKRSYSNNTQTISSDDYATSLSYSYSIPFSHDPSCSLTCNSNENYEHSRENDQIWNCGGEGTNGSVHSRFKPVGDSNNICSSNHNKELNNSLYRSNSSENHSFFPSEIPARHMKENGLASSDHGRNIMLTRPDRVLREIVRESVPFVARMLQELPSDSIEAVKECLRNLVNIPEKKQEFASLQRMVERSSDLTFETLSKSHKAQIEILVTIKTGNGNFLSEKNRIPTTELVEMFLLSRCRNMNCKSLLPVDDCDCKICSKNKGFCSACTCPICLNFDCALNTCSWVGCDVCSHWCHAVCGIQKNLIRPGPSLRGPVGTTEMQFHCLGCGHASEMFGFVKDVFMYCAKDWGLESLMKELDCVRKIFHGSEDFKGKELQSKAEEMLIMLSKKLITPLDAGNSILQFFNYGVSEYSVSGSSSKDTITALTNQTREVLPLPPPATIIPSKSIFSSNPAPSRLDLQRDARKTDPKILVHEPHFGPVKEDGLQSLESIMRFKVAEARLFQRLADEARREVESYRQIVRAKSEKLEEEYASKLAKLCLQETDEKRRKKLEELKFLENSRCDYDKMKVRMQAEIANLLERMEATKQQWV